MSRSRPYPVRLFPGQQTVRAAGFSLDRLAERYLERYEKVIANQAASVLR